MSAHQRWVTVRNTGLLIALGVLAIAESGAAADAKKGVLPDADYPKLVKRLTKGIQDALKGGSPSDEAKEKARTAAVLIAAAAQQRLDGPRGQQRATVRDAALKAAAAIKSGKYDDALKLVDSLATLKEDPDAKKERLPLVDGQITFPELMHQFRPASKGGWNIYGHLQKLQTDMKPVLPRQEVNENFILEAEQVALTADLALTNPPKDKPKEFTAKLELMREGAVELAEALKDKEAAKAAPAPLEKLTKACIGCHNTFRK